MKLISRRSLHLKKSSRLKLKRRYVTIFNRDTKTIQKNASARRIDSKHFDYLKSDIASRLIDRLNDIVNKTFPDCLDLGAQTGYCLPFLQEKGIKTLYQTDLSIDMLNRDREEHKNFNLKPIKVVCSEEKLPFKSKSFDLVVSNLSLHWVNDLEGCFKEINRVLKEDGVFFGFFFWRGNII